MVPSSPFREVFQETVCGSAFSVLGSNELLATLSVAGPVSIVILFMYRPLPFQLGGVGTRSYGDGPPVTVTNPFSSGDDLTVNFLSVVAYAPCQQMQFKL